MAIFQPILSSEIGARGVPSPVNNFAGIDALGRGLEGLVGVAGDAIEAFSSGQDQALANEYLSAIETARSLKIQGKSAEARQYLRNVGIKLSKEGLDISDKMFDEARKQFGVGEKFMMDPQDRLREAAFNDPSFAGFYGKSARELREKFPDASEDEIIEKTVANFIDYTTKKQSLTNDELDDKIVYRNLTETIDTETGVLLDSMFEYIKSNDFVDQSTLKGFMSMSKEIKKKVLGLRPWSPEQVRQIEAKFSAVDETLKYMEDLNSAEGIADTLKVKSIQYVLQLAQDPENRFGITPQDFNNYVLSIESVDKLATLMTVPGFTTSIERVNKALTEMTLNFRTTTAEERKNFSNRRPFDDVVDPQNTLQGDIDSRVNSEEYSVDEWEDIIKLTLPGRLGDPSKAADPKRAKEIAIVTGWSAATLNRMATEKDKFISEADAKTIFSPKLKAYLDVMAKSHPDVFFDVFDHLSANTNKYATYVTNRVAQLEASLGVTFEEDGTFSFSPESVTRAAGIKEEEVAMVSKGLGEALKVAYGVSSVEAGLKAASRDGGDRLVNRISADLRADPSVQNPAFREASKVATHFQRVLRESQLEKHADMFAGLKVVKDFTNKVSGAFSVNDPAVPGKMRAFAGLLPAMDKGEGGGDYDTLWAHSQKTGAKFSGVKITDMTLNQILEFGRRGSESGYREWVDSTNKDLETKGSGAPFGRYQFVPGTIRDVMGRMNLTGNEVFTPQLQDAMFVNHVEWVLRDASSADEAFRKLKGTWPGLSTSQLRAWVNEFYGVTEGGTTE